MHRFFALVILGIVISAAGALRAADTRELELTSRVFGNTRALRVLLPPGYDLRENAGKRYPVFYFTDGVAAFAADGWNVPGVARSLWEEGRLREMIFVGIDNGGSTRESTDPARDRAGEYLPFVDQTWEEATRPEPRGDRFPAFLFDEVMPLVDRMFRTRRGAEHTGLAGDSFAGAAALYTALLHGERLGWVLIESPSLHIGNGKLLELARETASWPPNIYLGVGTAEGETEAIQKQMVENVHALYDVIDERAPASRRKLIVIDGATHWYDAWRERLPQALVFLTPPDQVSSSE